MSPTDGRATLAVIRKQVPELAALAGHLLGRALARERARKAAANAIEGARGSLRLAARTLDQGNGTPGAVACDLMLAQRRIGEALLALGAMRSENV